MPHHAAPRTLRAFGLAALLVVALSGCPQPSDPEPIYSGSVSWDSSGAYAGWDSAGTAFKFRTYEPTRNEDVDFTVSDLSPGNKAWLVITNADEGEAFPLSGGLASVARSVAPSRNAASIASRGAAPRILRDIPEVSEFNANPPQRIRSASRSVYMPVQQPPQLLVVGSSTKYLSLMEFSTSLVRVNKWTTLMAERTTTIEGWTGTVQVWVAQESLAGGANTEEITTEMANAVLDKFLVDGSDNDILDWVTGVFGDEFTEHSWANIIPDNDTIVILIADIYEQDVADGGVIGYFDSFNLLVNDLDHPENVDSNIRAMLYIDAPMLANPDGGVDNEAWEADDYWPQEIYSTLAHELQHLIHFNQKALVRDVGYSPTWFDEMCSAAAEDIVSQKLGIEGPRGIDPTDGSAGVGLSKLGRLPDFAYYPDYSLTIWDGSNYNYAAAYAFAAWLGRNKGAQVFDSLVQSPEVGFDALRSVFSGSSNAEILRDWAVAAIGSGSVDMPVPLQFNRGGWFPDGSTTGYPLGSIDLAKYQWGEDVADAGLYPYYNIPNGIEGGIYPASNMYIELPTTGTASGRVRLYEGMSMTVVVQP